MCIACTVQSRPIFIAQNKDQVTPYEVKDWIVAFLEGFGIGKYSNTTADCQNHMGVFYDLTASGVGNYINSNYYDGTLNITDALGELSPVSRNCYNSTNELSVAFSHYISQFNSTANFFSKISFNALVNFKQIQDTATKIIAEFYLTKNITNMCYYAGEITSYVFVIENNTASGPLRYTEFDPLSPNPINDIMWNIFEGLYKFVTASKLATLPTIKKCQEGILNMIALDEKAYEYYTNGDGKNAWFSAADSFTFSRNIFEGCYLTTIEVIETSKKVKEQIIDQGKIGDNAVKNLYYVISDVVSLWSQIFYHDWISLAGLLGDLVFRVLVDGIN